MPFSAGAKDSMLDSQTLDGVRLHSGDPGAAGTANTVDAGINAATFAAASSASRALSADVDVTGLGNGTSVTHFSVWTTAGAVFKGSGTISSGDVAANAAGEYTLLATSTTVGLSDA